MLLIYHRICIVIGGFNAINGPPRPYLLACSQDSGDDDFALRDAHHRIEVQHPIVDEGDYYTFYLNHANKNVLIQALEKITSPQYASIISSAINSITTTNKLSIKKTFVQPAVMEDGIVQDYVVPYFIAESPDEAMSLNTAQYMMKLSTIKVYRIVNMCYVPVKDETDTITVYFMNRVDMPIMVSRITLNTQGVKLITQGGRIVRIAPAGDDHNPVMDLCAKINATIGVYRTLVNNEIDHTYVNSVDGIDPNLMSRVQQRSKDIALRYAKNMYTIINDVVE